MIRALLLSVDGQHTQGAEELIQQWRDTAGSSLWIDIQGEVTTEIRQLLRSLDCNDLAITDCSRT